MPASYSDGAGASLVSRVLHWVNSLGKAVPAAPATPMPAALYDATGQLMDFSGLTGSYKVDSAAASTNAATVKAAPGRVVQIEYKVAAAYDVFLKIFNVTGVPVPGTTPVRDQIRLPASSSGVINIPEGGIYCSTGIGIALTKLVAENDTTVLVAADVTAFRLRYT